MRTLEIAWRHKNDSLVSEILTGSRHHCSPKIFSKMKLSLSLAFLSLVVTATNAFQPALQNGIRRTELNAIKNPMEQLLRNLSNNFTPIHGHGSLEDDLEDQWQAQQELLKERQRKNIDKEHLKKKYKDPKNRESFNLDVGLSKNSASKKNSFWDNNISP